jgi:hypothetical protein
MATNSSIFKLIETVFFHQLMSYCEITLSLMLAFFSFYSSASSHADAQLAQQDNDNIQPTNKAIS